MLARALARTVRPRAAARLSSTAAAPAPPASEDIIREKLTAHFAPSELAVQDVSGGCGEFFAVTIASARFAGLPTVQQHRLVTSTLKQEIAGIHGLQIKTIVP